MNSGYVLLIIFATIFAVYSILLHFGVFEFATRPRKVATEIESKRKLNKKRNFEKNKLQMYTSATNMFRGVLMPESVYEKHMYYIQRLELRSNILNRLLTPEELRGQYVLPVLLSLLFIPLVLFKPVIIIVPAIAVVRFATYQTSFRAKISDEDTMIDNYFIDLYLLLYSKLRRGSRARLQGTVENYIDTLESSKSTKESKVMLKLSKYLLNLLALYEDHVAVPKLKEVYHSATVINFCNVATQALQGIENWDNLLTFKMQLTERRTNLMRIRQQKILRSGERSIFAIWIILGIFIVVGWWSKLPTGFF